MTDKMDADWVQFETLFARAFGQAAAGQPKSAVIADYTAAIAAITPYREMLSELQRNDLATAYVNRGNAKQDAAGHGPGAAVQDYDQAITIMQALRQTLEPQGAWDPPLRNGLAKAYVNRGNAKRSAAGHGPGAAVQDYDQAITIMQALRQTLEPQGAWDPPLHNGLANAYMNRGNAKQDAAGHGPGAAVQDYDQAITIREALRQTLEPQGAWDPPLRNGLANAYMNRGNAKQDAAGHGPGAAVQDYDQAITIMQALRQTLEPQGAWDPPLRNDLAGAYVNRGNAKRSAAGHGPGAALTDLQASLELLTALLVPQSVVFPPAIETKLLATLVIGQVLQALSRPDEATDFDDQGLETARLAEQIGVTWYRALREQLFAQTLDHYRAAGMITFLPKVIFDDLDPAAPGSAVDSAPMHQAAVSALAGARTELAAGDTADVQSHRQTLLDAQVRLATLQIGQFAGLAAFARINAAAEAAAGRIEEAERILTRQITWRRLDPDGFASRADFFAEIGQRDKANADLLQAARLTIRLIGVPAVDSVAPVALLGAQMLQLQLEMIEADDTLSDPTQGQAVRDQFTQLAIWLVRDLPDAILADPPGESDDLAKLSPAQREAWRGPLINALQARQLQADIAREDLLARQQKRWEGDLRAHFANERSILSREIIRQLRDKVPLPWIEFIQAMLLALEDAQMKLAALAELERQAAITEALEQALRTATERLNAHELQDDITRLMALLGPDWQLLEAVEQRYLACAERCAGQPVLAKFALLELACGVEWSLLNRLLQPLKNRLQAQRQHPLPLSSRAIPERLYEYLIGSGHRRPMLGDFVRGYTEASKLLNEAAWPNTIQGGLAAWLARCPNAEVLRNVSAERQAARRKALRALSDARNAIAHPSWNTELPQDVPPAIDPHWQAMVADKADAFFRYFPALFQQPPSMLVSVTVSPDVNVSGLSGHDPFSSRRSRSA